MAATPQKRTQTNRVNFASYPQDYFTGAQVRIYIGSIWVDDIATISYTTSHSKTPLYGYADHQFRAVAKGQFLVRGSFTIAFKEVGYLYQIIQMWRNDKTGSISLKKPASNSGTDFLKVLQTSQTIEVAMDSLAGRQDFEDAAEVMQDAIWGKTTASSVSGNNNPRKIPRTDELDYDSYLQKDLTDEEITVDLDNDLNGFDILITFGDYRSGNNAAETTIVSLNGVHITGESMVVTPSAEPIGLTCEFFARGINERISNAWPDSARASADQARKDKLSPQQQAAQNSVGNSQNPQVDNTTAQQAPSDASMSQPAPKAFGTANDQAKFNQDVWNLKQYFDSLNNQLGPVTTLVQKNNPKNNDQGMIFASCFSKIYSASNIGGGGASSNIMNADKYNTLVRLYNYMQNITNWKPSVFYFCHNIIYKLQENVDGLSQDDFSSSVSFDDTLSIMVQKALSVN